MESKISYQITPVGKKMPAGKYKYWGIVDPLILRVSGSVLEMGGEGSVPWTPLQCMLRNFKKGFSRDYGNPRSQVKKDQIKTKPVLKTEPYEEDNSPPYAPVYLHPMAQGTQRPALPPAMLMMAVIKFPGQERREYKRKCQKQIKGSGLRNLFSPP
ncbi:hypothetical protein E2320_018435 [Naja naja]|nr:hypothetical protein E2320_018435 [Naja naja]